MPEFESWVAYRPIPGFPGYMVGNDGTVWSKMRCGRTARRVGDQWHQMRTCQKSTGHLSVMLCPGRVRRQVHRLVLESFIGPRPEGMEACHNDGDPTNNGMSNLRWDTPKNNQCDRVIHGRGQFGESNASSKLTEKDVEQIHRLYEECWTQKRIAKKFGVSRQQVSKILLGTRWPQAKKGEQECLGS